MSPERKSTTPDDLPIDQTGLFDIEIWRKETKARRDFAAKLKEAIGSRVSFQGVPDTHVLVHTRSDGERTSTQVPYYGPLDAKDPLEYKGVTIVGVFDYGWQLGVTAPECNGDNYHLVPLDSITDFVRDDTEAPAS